MPAEAAGAVDLVVGAGVALPPQAATTSMNAIRAMPAPRAYERMKPPEKAWQLAGLPMKRLIRLCRGE